MKNLSQKRAAFPESSPGIFCVDCVMKEQHYSLARNPFSCAGDARVMFALRNLNVLASLKKLYTSRLGSILTTVSEPGDKRYH